jgi:hypothetical protein
MTKAASHDRAMRDPTGAFETPEAVIEARDLTAEQKRQILERWRQSHGATASGQGGEPNLATRLARALGFLDEETGAQPTTHDQGFYTAVSDIGGRKSEDKG